MAVTKCRDCGEPVKYINASRSNTIYCCETTTTLGVLPGGRSVDAYLLHKCSGKPINANETPMKKLIGGKIVECNS